MTARSQCLALLAAARVAAAALMASVLAAQQPSAWAELSPPGGVDPSKFTALATTGTFGKLMLYRDGQYLRVYSTVTGRWHAHTPSFGTTPVLLPEILLVPESDRWTALSAYRGVFEVQMVNFATSTLTTGTSIAVVRAGSNAYVFSAFTGRWHARTIPANWRASLGERIATFTDPSFTTFGGSMLFDALSGQWHDLPAQNVTLARGNQSASTFLWLFQRADQTTYQATWTTHRPVWQFHQLPAIPPLFNQGGGGLFGSEFVAIWDLAFSGLTHTLTPLGRDVSPTTAGLVATAFDTVAQSYACLGITGTAWVPMPAGAVVVTGGFDAPMCGVRLFALGNQTLAFNGLTGSMASVANDRGPLPYGSGIQGSLIGAVADLNTGRVDVYSAVTGQWHAVPANVLPEPIAPRPMPVATRTSVILRTSTGVTAFSGRTAAFVPLDGTGLVRLQSGAVRDATHLHVFDARADRWLSTPLVFAPGPFPYTNGTEIVATDAAAAVGYGARASRLERLPLPEPSLQSGVLDGGGFVRTAGRLYGFSGLPDNLSFSGFPEDFSVVGPGSTWRHQVRLPQGGVAVVALSPRTAAPLPLPPFGDLWLDPIRLILLEAGFAAPGEHRATFALPLPDLPELRRTEWFLQSIVVPAAGQAWLTDAANLFLL